MVAKKKTSDKKVSKKTSKKTSKRAGSSSKKRAKSVRKVVSSAKSISKKVSDDKVFFLIDGTTISSLKELVDTFDRMSDDIYYYHVTNDRNDFSNWVRDVLKMEKLADELIGAQGPMKAECVILKHLLNW